MNNDQWIHRFGIVAALLCGLAVIGDPAGPVNPSTPAKAESLQRLYLPWIGRSAGAAARIVNYGGGTTRALAADGDRVYAGIDSRLVVFDVADPDAPRMIAASEPLGDEVMDIAVVGRTVYVAAQVAGLHYFDVSGAAPPISPTPLVPLGVLGIGGDARGLAVVAGQWLYVATEDDYATGLAIVDVSEPLRPRIAHRFGEIGNAWAVAASPGRWVWLAHGGQALRGFDVTDPARPDSTRLFGNDSDAHSELDLRLAGRYAFILTTYRLSVFDLSGVVSTADTGTLVATLEAQHCAPSLAISGDRLFVAGYVTGVRVVDARDPTKPVFTADLPVDGGSRVVTVAGNRLYAGGPAVQLAVFDLDAGGQATPRGTYAAPRPDVASVATTGRVMAALYDAPAGEPDLRSDLGAFPAERPDLAVPAGVLPLSAKPEDVKLAALRGRDYAYLLYYNALEAVDLTAPAKPEKRRTLAVPDATDFVVDGNYAFVAGDGLRVIDLTVADDPQQIAYQFRAGTGQAIAADGATVTIAQRAATGDRPTDLWVFDVSNRASPRQIGTLGDIKTTVDLAMAGGYVYQVYNHDRVYGLKVYDVRDPTRPRAMAAGGPDYPTDGYARAVVRDGTRLYLVEEAYFDRVARRERGRNGVHIIDIRVPNRPRLVQFIAFPAPIGGIDVWGGTLYVAARQAGVVAIDLEE